MPLQKRNAELVSLLSADLQPRYEPNFAWGQASGMLLTPGLRGFWPMSSVPDTGNVVDQSGQNRTLTNNGPATFGLQGLAPTLVLSGAEHLSRTDESGVDITGALTCGGWAYYDNVASASEVLIAKTTGAAGHRSFALYRQAAAVARFWISDDCTNYTQATSTSTMAPSTWYFLWGRYYANGANSQVDVGINRDYWTQAETNGAICNSDADFTIGATAAPDSYMTGRIALPFLAAYYVPDCIMWNIFEQTRALFGV